MDSAPYVPATDHDATRETARRFLDEVLQARDRAYPNVPCGTFTAIMNAKRHIRICNYPRAIRHLWVAAALLDMPCPED